ncbi:hypothetical protein Vadar_027266 [Vaccinium darrowii]|uniref:Uncharacterized protein n=1 Tax=Vaccinium darrowii TaxID=229202 RepID=A0ACB7YG53_9ERIC|nr:hypothetical protein Vadar_027266 [Vaccinium darrowii]
MDPIQLFVKKSNEIVGAPLGTVLEPQDWVRMKSTVRGILIFSIRSAKNRNTLVVMPTTTTCGGGRLSIVVAEIKGDLRSELGDLS